MDEIIVFIPKKIENNIEGFEFFTKLYKVFKESYNKKVILDFSKTRWLEANLSAILGAILSFGLINNKIVIKRVSKSIIKILIKNKFFESFGIGENLEDKYETTIKYSEFAVTDKIKFQKYLKEEFIPRLNLSMSNEFDKEHCRIDFQIKQKQNPNKYKMYKNNFRNTKEFNSLTEDICDIINNKIFKYAKKLNDDFSNIDMTQILIADNNFDFNDKYFTQLCEDSDIKILTNDKDFLKFSNEIEIITN